MRSVERRLQARWARAGWSISLHCCQISRPPEQSAKLESQCGRSLHQDGRVAARSGAEEGSTLNYGGWKASCRSLNANVVSKARGSQSHKVGANIVGGRQAAGGGWPRRLSLLPRRRNREGRCFSASANWMIAKHQLLSRRCINHYHQSPERQAFRCPTLHTPANFSRPSERCSCALPRNHPGRTLQITRGHPQTAGLYGR